MAKNKAEPEAATPASLELVTVRAAVTLSEGGTLYQPGETLETTAERAAALGDAVTPA